MMHRCLASAAVWLSLLAARAREPARRRAKGPQPEAEGLITIAARSQPHPLAPAPAPQNRTPRTCSLLSRGRVRPRAETALRKIGRAACATAPRDAAPTCLKYGPAMALADARLTRGSATQLNVLPARLPARSSPRPALRQQPSIASHPGSSFARAAPMTVSDLGHGPSCRGHRRAVSRLGPFPPPAHARPPACHPGHTLPTPCA